MIIILLERWSSREHIAHSFRSWSRRGSWCRCSGSCFFIFRRSCNILSTGWLVFHSCIAAAALTRYQGYGRAPNCVGTFLGERSNAGYTGVPYSNRGLEIFASALALSERPESATLATATAARPGPINAHTARARVRGHGRAAASTAACLARSPSTRGRLGHGTGRVLALR